MSWVNILKKNDKEFEKPEDNKIIIKEEKIQIYDSNILILEDEFEYLYLNKIINIITEFKDYIYEDFLPFFQCQYKDDKNDKYNLYEFIKYNCIEYYDLSDKVNKENELYLKELEELNDDEYYEEYD
jgi:hypothetical protein